MKEVKRDIMLHNTIVTRILEIVQERHHYRSIKFATSECDTTILHP